jgi:hypothetical protein
LNPTVAQEVSAIIARCLKKNPMDRYRHAQDLLDDTRRLRGLVPHSEARSIRQTLAAKVRAAQQTWSSKTARLVAVVATGLVLVVGIGWYLTGSIGKTTPKAETGRESSAADEAAPVGASDEMRSVTIGIFGGEADVYDLDNQLLKHITSDEPYQFKGKVGSKYQLLLRREGEEIHVNGEITDHNNSYHY